MKNKIFIYGAGGLGRELLSMLRGSEEWEPGGFLDDRAAKGTAVGGVKILGGIEVLRQLPKPSHLLLAFGDPKVKREVAFKLRDTEGLRFPALLHPRAILQDRDSIMIGAGTIITAGCILTTEIRIGSHVLINLNCTVGHNAVLGDYSSVMPGANLAGNVRIGEAVLVGSGANLLNGITVGNGGTVGAGAVVTRDVADGDLVVGIPAKRRS